MRRHFILCIGLLSCWRSDLLGADVAVRTGVEGRLGEHHVHRSGRGRRRHAGQTTFADLGFLEGGGVTLGTRASEASEH